MSVSKLKLLFVFAAAIASLGCQAKESSVAKSESAAKPLELYEVHHDGRINVFYDKKTYKEFLEVGETLYRLTKIGAGPNGETLVYGLSGADKKTPEKVTAIQLLEGKTKAPEDFYAVMHKHNRIYVFDNYDDMKPVRELGHPSYFYTEIGSGPKGETVVYVLNGSNKNNRPDALIAEYKSRQ